jgi:hypothetical protein
MKTTTTSFSRIIILAMLLLGISSCYKSPVYSVIPNISFKSFVVNSNRSATLQVTFTDGDGDIGYPTNYNNPPYDFYVMPLYDSAGLGAYKYYWTIPVPVFGDTRFMVWIVDRAGHVSNRIVTAPIVTP